MSSGTSRRPLLRVCGVLAIVAGVIGGVGLWLTAGQRLDDAVAGMARAPVGCDTVLDFDTAGTYLLFVETEGELDEVRGDCDVDTEFERDEGDLPSVTLTMFGPDGSEVDLETDDGVSYETATSSGTSVDSVAIDAPGDHVLRVESDDADFVIAVGRNPNDGVLLLRVLAIGVAVAGIVIGVSLLVRARRRNEAPATDADAWVPSGADPEWPMSPPGFPAPPPTTGTSAVVGPPSGPSIAPSSAPLPVPPPHQPAPPPAHQPGRPPSVAPIPGQPVPGETVPGETARWGPPPPPAGKLPGG